ncbi:hydrogenase maturation protease [soil metagenome]
MNVSAEPHTKCLEFFDTHDSLIYGIGNVGRQDDGLGWAFVDRLEAAGYLRHAELQRTYQLNLEDADLINGFARVLFVDATKDPAITSFALTRPAPKFDMSFTSHAISVPAIVATAGQCFDRVPDIYLLAIRGYEWELQMGLTASAETNLRQAIADLIDPGYRCRRP